MEKKINIAQLLKDCPKGMELYSPIFGTVYFEGIRDTGRAILIDVTTSCNTSVQFYSDGKFNTYYSESEVTLFPSKSQRDWYKFQIPFKDGDIIYTETKGDNKWLSIYKELEGHNLRTYANILLDNNLNFYYNLNRLSSIILCLKEEITEQRLANEEEKQKLFDAIKANGYHWDAETKTLEKLIEPKFKVGDKIKNKNTGICVKVIKICEDCYLVENCLDRQATIDFNIQDNWELVPDKFDITILKAFDKVLVRDCNEDKWNIDFFSYCRDDGAYQCMTFTKNQCIPNEGNEHLLGTANDCESYYKTW